MAKIRNALNSGLNAYRRVRSEYSHSYNTGYRTGADDYRKISKRFGSRSLAVTGYINGMNGAHKNYRYRKKIEEKK